MTKAAKPKTKSRRVWFISRFDGSIKALYQHHGTARLFCDGDGNGETVIPATLTWTPPKKRAKR